MADMNMRRDLILALLAAALALVVMVAGWFLVIAPREAEVATTLGRGDYSLQATDGTAFTEKTLEDGPSAVFFGFTHCPEVCPTTLGDITTWKEELGPDADALRVYFVTVDPERDTSDILGDYVGWAPGVVGVTGSREEIDKAIQSFRVFSSRVPLEGGDYTMDHSAYVLLFDRDGQFSDPIRYQEEADSALRKLRAILEG